MEGYEFDLFGYQEDLEYGDDSYWDYGTYGKDEQTGEKRKRGSAGSQITPSKKRKSAREDAYNRELEPLVFRSRDERTQRFLRDPPLQENRAPFSFLGDWKERFARADGIVTNQKMPASMKAAAEAKSEDTPEKANRLHDADSEDQEGEEGDWEDDEGEEGEEEEDGEGGLAIDPEMLKAILREKLADAGLDGMDESAFMNTIKQMLSAEGDSDDAAGTLANSLLGKLTSDTGDQALSGWLSGQGVSLEQDDDASSVTMEQQDTLKSPAAPKQRLEHSATDSTIELHKTTQMPLHEGSPNGTTKKRKLDTTAEGAPRKKTKKVTFDVPPSSSSQPEQNDVDGSNADVVTGDDLLTSEMTINERSRAANSAAVEANRTQADEEHTDGSATVQGEAAPAATSSQKAGRKRKAAAAEISEEKPVEKKSRNRELQHLEPLPHTPSPGGPARRTRHAKAKAGK